MPVDAPKTEAEASQTPSAPNTTAPNPTTIGDEQALDSAAPNNEPVSAQASQTSSSINTPNTTQSFLAGLAPSAANTTNAIMKRVKKTGAAAWYGGMKKFNAAKASADNAFAQFGHFVSQGVEDMENFLKTNVIKPGDVVVWTGHPQHIATMGFDGRLHCEVPQDSLFAWDKNPAAAAHGHIVVMRPPSGANKDGMLANLAAISADRYNHRCAHHFQLAARDSGYVPSNFVQPPDARDYPAKLLALKNQGYDWSIVAQFNHGQLMTGSEATSVAESSTRHHSTPSQHRHASVLASTSPKLRHHHEFT